MIEFARNAGALGAVLGLLALTGPLRGRWGWVSWPLAAAALAMAIAWEMLDLSLLSSLLVLEPGALVIAWLALGWATLRAGGPRLPTRSLGAQAVFLGALAGPWVSAALLAPACSDPRQRARAILTATSASLLLSPAAHPLALTQGSLDGRVTLLALAGVALAWPKGEVELEGSPMATAALLLAGLGCALSPVALPVLLAALALAWFGGDGRATERPPWIWLGGVLVAVALAQLAGSLHQAGVGADFLIGQAPLGTAGLALASGGLHALLGEAGAAVILSPILDSVVVPRGDTLPVLLLGGATAGGGLVAMALAGWRSAWLPWLGQLLLIAAWGAWLSA